MSSRKSSTSSVSSITKVQGASNAPKSKTPLQPLTKKPEGAVKKVTYSTDVTEENIQDDKSAKRYEMMMQKLNEISLINSKSKEKDPNRKVTSTTKLAPMNPPPGISSKPNSPIPKVNGTKIPIKKNDKVEDTDDSDDDHRESLKAPNELLEEFLIYIMDKKWEDAHKLCRFILMYEPNNSTAREFLPLIERKIELMKKDGEKEEESEDDDDDNDSNSTDEDDDDDSDSNDDDDDDDDDSSDSSDDSEETDNDENEKDNKKYKISPKKKSHDDDDDVQIPSASRKSK